MFTAARRLCLLLLSYTSRLTALAYTVGVRSGRRGVTVVPQWAGLSAGRCALSADSAAAVGAASAVDAAQKAGGFLAFGCQ